MPAKIVLSVIVLALIGGGVALTATGNVALIMVGALFALIGLVFAKVSYTLLRDPQSAADRLTARRAQLEARAGRGDDSVVDAVVDAAPALEARSAAPSAPVPEAPSNRAARRAADRAGQQKGRPRRAPHA